MTDKEKVIKELKEALDSLDITNKYRLNLIRAIEYLQEEPVSDGLEKEMDSYFLKMSVQEHENIFEDTFKNIARHFANWQKQQIMKETIDAEILEMPDDGNTFFEHTHLEIHVENLPKEKYMNGDKVKLIIIKKE